VPAARHASAELEPLSSSAEDVEMTAGLEAGLDLGDARAPRRHVIELGLIRGAGLLKLTQPGEWVDVFLNKPCLPEDLEGNVRRLLSRGTG
jgi:hypothetical protein